MDLSESDIGVDDFSLVTDGDALAYWVIIRQHDCIGFNDRDYLLCDVPMIPNS